MPCHLSSLGKLHTPARFKQPHRGAETPEQTLLLLQGIDAFRCEVLQAWSNSQDGGSASAMICMLGRLNAFLLRGKAHAIDTVTC